MEHKLLTGNLFAWKKSRKLSYKEIAERLEISLSTAKRWVKKDLKNGYLLRERTKYNCKKYSRPLQGRNVYHLSPQAEHLTPQRSFPKKTLVNKSLLRSPHPKRPEKCQKKGFRQTLLSKEEQRKKEAKEKLLEKFGFKYLALTAPDWWFLSPEILRKTLRLLKSKKAKGYHVKHEGKWISSAMKDGGRGYSYKRGKEYTLVVAGQQKQLRHRKFFPNLTPTQEAIFFCLKDLKKRGLVFSFTEAKAFLRKGWDHLRRALHACLKALKKRTVADLNKFLHFLVSLKNPMDVFKKTKEPLPRESARECAVERILQSLGRAVSDVQMKRGNIFSLRPVGRLEEKNLSEEQRQEREKIFYHIPKTSKTEIAFFAFEGAKWVETVFETHKQGAQEKLDAFFVEKFGFEGVKEFILSFGYAGERSPAEWLSHWTVLALCGMISQKRGFRALNQGQKVEDNPKSRLQIYFQKCCDKKCEFFFFDRLELRWKKAVFDAQKYPSLSALKRFWAAMSFPPSAELGCLASSLSPQQPVRKSEPKRAVA